MKTNLIMLMMAIIATTIGCSKDDNSFEQDNMVINGSVAGKINYIGAVSGITYNASGARVYMLEGTCTPTILYDKTTITDNSGRYFFNDIAPGIYALDAEVTVNGFDYYGKTCVTISDGQNRTVNFTLY